MKEFLMAWAKFLFFTPVALISVAVLYFFYCEANKAYWDYRVKEMCLKDGGVTVFEKVAISQKDYPNLKFRSTGYPILPSERMAKPTDPFYISFESQLIYKNSLSVERSKTKIIRKSDLKTLSIKVQYGRSGGDFPTGISAPSSFFCSSTKNINTNLGKSTFLVKGE